MTFVLSSDVEQEHKHNHGRDNETFLNAVQMVGRIVSWEYKEEAEE